MFDITDTEIVFQNRTVATLKPLSLGFRRDLEDAIRDYCTADDFEEDHAE